MTMMPPTARYSPAVKDIVLVGGGHSHALLIRMWAMNPIPGLRLTLVSPQVNTPYSGMLPGLVAGHYTHAETHIDLVKLCSWAKVRFIQGQVMGLDRDKRELWLVGRPALGYDVCSMDMGSTPSLDIKGSETHAIAVKPISEFWKKWQSLQEQLQASRTERPHRIVVVGGGHGGVEMVLAMAHWGNVNGISLDLSLCHRGEQLFDRAPKAQRQKVMKELGRLGVKVELKFACEEITSSEIVSRDSTLPYDTVFCCTHAMAAPWLKSTGLDLSDRGFIRVNDHLQSTNMPNVFAAGDISHLDSGAPPKAGVYAVRMAPILFHNVVAYALEKEMKAYRAQRDFLSLSALGRQYAVGRRNGWSFSGGWVWRWKDRIDRKFMKMFEDLPDVMNENHEQGMEEVLLKALDVGDVRELAMRCGGCGAKIGADVLSQVLGELDIMDHPQVLVGLNAPDDAAVLSLPSGHHWVQTVDVLKNFMDDPYLFGQLSALHAMSDVFAMNAQVQSAQALVQLPLMAEALQVRDMKQLMAGALKVLQAHGCALVGGHSSEDQVLGLGFAINGVIESEGTLSRKRGLEEGQVLILTKALGTGALFAAHMRARAKGEHVEAALASMLRSNQKAAQVFNGHGASAVTDVTGFGLLGHMAEMCKGSECGVKIDMDALPQLEGVSACFEQQIFSSLQPHNQRFRRLIENQETIRHHCHYPILFDPQTCGGLLGAVSKSKAKAVVDDLVSAGYGEACVVATVLSHGTGFVVE